MTSGGGELCRFYRLVGELLSLGFLNGNNRPLAIRGFARVPAMIEFGQVEREMLLEMLWKVPMMPQAD
jgi:hypothetical protein